MRRAVLPQHVLIYTSYPSFLSRSPSVEWQAYAAKHVSIQPELDRLFQLVARWRKLEIDMWDNTLEYRERKLAKRANRSFFHPYDLVFVVPETSSEESESFDEYLGSLHEELDRFVLQSNLAEIRPRLRLLESCARQIWSEASCEYVSSAR